jgi:hypothetical protein
MSLGEFFISALPSRNARLIATFAAFVLVQFLFAGLYYSLYRQRRSHFSFNSDILRAQAREVERLAANNRFGIEVLKEALQELEAGATPAEVKAGDQLTLPSGRSIKVTRLSGGPYGAAPAGNVLEVFNADGEMLFESTEFEPPQASVFRRHTRSAHWIRGAKEWKDALTNVLANAQIRRDRDEQRLASLATPEPDVWSFWDFFYFSTIIQTTVGLGDILPNTTLVRMIVTTQVLIGYALLIVVLNIVLASSSS